MRRRAYLAALAATLGVAGCSGTDEPTATPAATGTDATPTATEPPADTPTDTATPEPTETDTATETPKDTETPEDEPPQQAQRYIEDARDRLRSAYDSYLNQADGGGTLLDVGVDVEFSSGDVVDELDRAEIPINNAAASRTNDEQDATIADMQAFRATLEVLAEVQADLGRGPDRVDDHAALVFEQRLNDLGTIASDFTNAADAAQGELDEFDDSVLEETPAESLEWLGPSELRDKYQQLRAGTDSAAAFGTALSEAETGITWFDNGNQDYVDERYQSALDAYERAADAFDDADQELSLVDFGGDLGDSVAALGAAMGPLSEGTSDLATAAARAADGDSTQADRAASDAQDHFYENDDVVGMAVVDGAPDGV